MAFWSSLFKREQPIEVFTPNVTYVADASGLVEALNIGEMSPSRLWACQPHLRTVVSFVARNIAQLGLHVFERVDETDRRRDRTSLAARTIAGVDGLMTTYDLVFALVGDLLLYDRAYWWVAESSSTTSGWMIRRLPPSWVSENRSNPFEVDSYRVALGNQSQTIPASKILPFTSYSPAKTSWGSSTVESLKQTLQEQIEAARYRSQVWEKGGRVSAVLERPKDAPQWTVEQRDRFREDWYAKYTGRGSRAGGTPILEDGMKLSRIDFNAQEQQFVEAAKLSLSTVAAAFHVNPTMVGVLDNANFSNVEAFRKMLYADSLGPYITQIEQRINTFLLSMLGMDPARFYVEFNIAEKLQGSFQEQTTALQSATGAPWMTRAEARARMNLPAIPDSDGLVIPLNVLIGGQASPNDSGSQNHNSRPVLAKARADSWQSKAEKVLRDFYVRQERSVRSAMGSKAADWWDTERWDGELSDDLFRLATSIAGEIGPKQAQDLGFKPDDYDTARTLKFLRTVADRRAQDMNAATLAQLEAALKADDPAAAVDSVWTVAQESRSQSSGAALVTFASAFAVGEAAHQLIADKATKTWITGPNPRPAHAAMSGETVPLDEPFSNGMMRPGDSFDVDQVAGCFVGETAVSAATIELAYRREYRGRMVTIETESGKKLTGTPNHPILTESGWVALGKLREHDNLVCYLRDADAARDHDVDGMPSEISEVFDALAETGPSMRIRGLVVDFHGDGSESDIDVVGTDRKLRSDSETSTDKRISEFGFVASDPGIAILDALSSANPLDSGSDSASGCGVRRAGDGSAFIDREIAMPVESSVRSTAYRDASAEEHSTDGTAADPRIALKGIFGFSGYVATDKIISVVEDDFSGHVYNLQTASGCYLANAIVAHNCNCSISVQRG